MKVRINNDMVLDIDVSEEEISYEKLMGIAQTLKKFDKLSGNIKRKGPKTPSSDWIKVTPEMKRDAKKMKGPELAEKYGIPKHKGSNIVFRYGKH